MNWYRVELHTHTIASDGIMEPDELIRRSKARGYDAIVITDHNTTTSCQSAMNIGKKEGLLVIPGIEWTTFWGHIVITGGKSNVDWRSVNLENIDDKLAQVKKAGDLVTIAHPKRLGTPFCSECRFLYKIADYKNVDAYEVWSHYDPHIREESIKAKKEWSEIVNKGFKVTPVYGYDWHTPDEDGPAFAYTYVGMDGELNQENLMQAIKDGHTYMSMGVEINAKVIQNGKEYFPGDSIEKGEATIELSAQIVEEYQKQVYLNYLREDAMLAYAKTLVTNKFNKSEEYKINIQKNQLHFCTIKNELTKEVKKTIPLRTVPKGTKY